MTGRLHAAWRAGLRTTAALELCLALLVLPALSQHQHFGHSHPAGTAPHVHALSALLAAPSPTAATPEPPATTRAAAAAMYLAPFVTPACRGVRGRGPPVCRANGVFVA